MAHDQDGSATGPRGQLRTFLIADVRSYTRYTNERGDEAAARLAARFAEITRLGIEAHGGELLELRGDEALGAFMSARDALRAAVDLQRRSADGTPDRPAFPLGVGIGLDAGEGVPVEGGLRSGALNLAARLCSLAGPGQILASETTVSLARRVDGIRFEPRGAQRVKGLAQPVRVVEVLSDPANDPSGAGAPPAAPGRRRLPRRLLVGLPAAGVALLVGAIGLALLIGAASGTDRAPRVALVVGSDPGENPLAAQFSEGLLRAGRTFDLETETLVADDVDPSPADLRQLEEELDKGAFDLVLWAGYGLAADGLRDELAENPGTRFVYIDASLEGSDLDGTPNATAIHLDSEPAAELAGYLSGLMEGRRSSRVGDRAGVSAVGGLRSRVSRSSYGDSPRARVARCRVFGSTPSTRRISSISLSARSSPTARSTMAHTWSSLQRVRAEWERSVPLAFVESGASALIGISRTSAHTSSRQS